MAFSSRSLLLFSLLLLPFSSLDSLATTVL
jgi:hypothetical protein